MKYVKARHTNLKANHNKTNEAIKTNKKKNISNERLEQKEY